MSSTEIILWNSQATPVFARDLHREPGPARGIAIDISELALTGAQTALAAGILSSALTPSALHAARAYAPRTAARATINILA